ncbi:hypothetical protein Bbelb_246020 [Branchiostoma belcheri]|nr:hypothetical protein Bbelb_246020 [Branchiostoma belcheri]
MPGSVPVLNSIKDLGGAQEYTDITAGVISIVCTPNTFHMLMELEIARLLFGGKQWNPSEEFLAMKTEENRHSSHMSSLADDSITEAKLGGKMVTFSGFLAPNICLELEITDFPAQKSPAGLVFQASELALCN